MLVFFNDVSVKYKIFAVRQKMLSTLFYSFYRKRISPCFQGAYALHRTALDYIWRESMRIELTIPDQSQEPPDLKSGTGTSSVTSPSLLN